MRYLALILFVPTFAILGWLYWHFPRELPRSAARRRFDLAAMALATLLTVLALEGAMATRFPGTGPIWPQVFAVLAVYHVFPLVLALAWWVRGRRFRAAANAPGAAPL
ncbi:MAG: hypothetical protein KA911_03515 [Xanthomonadales bacterium]|nr:hypothetical protein [Xanthomonadales bacterium]HQX24208.1 hypothetical protein [Pseudomonadota bacterium]HRA38346.1 hypothetical protein [Pseudomonadota bacterium]